MNFFLNFARWYFSKKALPYWAILLLDSVIVMLAVVLVVALTEEAVNSLLHRKNLAIAIGGYLLCYLVGFRALHTYSGIIRYSTFVDLQRVAFSNLIGMVLSFVMRWGLEKSGHLPMLNYVDLLTVFMLATLMMWMLRVLVKFIYDMGYHSSRAKRVFVYGTRRGGVSLAKSIRSEENSRYVLAGFVTEDEKYIGRRMM